ncbi:MAG: type II toxin-antitoxin system RelB/DinJ family antitoxin [Patescibacteria group bacterium]
MSKVAVSIKIDKGIKEKTQKMLKKMGLPFSTFINAQLHQFTENKGVYFGEPSYPMSKKLEKIIKESEKNWKEGKNLSPIFSNAKDAVRWLNS